MLTTVKIMPIAFILVQLKNKYAMVNADTT
jgi:hypothetical protein